MKEKDVGDTYLYTYKTWLSNVVPTLFIFNYFLLEKKIRLYEFFFGYGRVLTFDLRLQHENGTPQASRLPTSFDEQLK